MWGPTGAGAHHPPLWVQHTEQSRPPSAQTGSGCRARASRWETAPRLPPTQHSTRGSFADTALYPHFLGLPAWQEERDDRTATWLPSGFGTSCQRCLIQKGGGLQRDRSCLATDGPRPLVPADAQGCSAGTGREARQQQPAVAVITREKVQFFKRKKKSSKILSYL